VERLLKGESQRRDIEIEQDFQPAGRRVLLLNARRVSADGSILLAFEDITERKRAAEARYRRLFESARDGIVIIDEPTGEILDINPYMEQLFGYPRREIVGRKLWEIEPGRDTASLQMMLEQARDQHDVRVPDIQFRTKDGRTIQTETIANLYHEGDRRAIQLNIRDLTDRRKFERELQDAQRLESLGLLAGGIAHDFNNLLTGILGNASLIYGDLPRDDPWRTQLRSILSASERAADLTRQLLAYAGKGRFIIEQVDLSGMVRDVIMLLKSSIPKTAHLKLDLAQHMPTVEADPSQMQQLIMNLVINAGEAIGEGHPGRIEIRTGERELTVEEIRESFVSEALRPGLYVRLEVKDTGVGMDEATKAKIFDPFFTTKFTGRGLGLAAVSGIVKALGGAIRVYSTPGHGSSFYVLLPAAAAARRPVRAKPAPRLKRGSGTILVVDDEDTVRQTARNILKKLGFEVLLADNGQAGVDVLRDQGELVSLVILDLTMPVMGGEQAFDSMRAIRKDVRIVLMSGYDKAEAAARTAGKDFTGFLQKPFTVDRLSEAVTSALKLKQQE
jgi:PAS domain S-box-containing protein